MKVFGSSISLAEANTAEIKIASEIIPNSVQMIAVFHHLEHSCPFVLLFNPNQLWTFLVGSHNHSKDNIRGLEEVKHSNIPMIIAITGYILLLPLSLF